MNWRSIGVLITLAVPALLLPMGCDTSPTDSMGDFRPVLYVEAFLKAGEPVEDIFVGTTMPLYEVYDRTASAVSDASVTLEVDGAASQLQPTAGSPGTYGSADLQIESGKTYRLVVQAEDFVAQAVTTVPNPPVVTANGADFIVNSTAFSASWEGETAGGYFTTKAEVEPGDPIPLESLFGGFGGRPFGGGFAGIDTTGFAAMRDSLARVQRWNYVQQKSTTLDWRQFYSYGTYAFKVYAIDENYADYLVSSQQDPQVLDEPRFHVAGGVGIFASMAADSVHFRVE